MRLSMVFELLLIFLLVAFAAYGRVIDRDEVNRRAIRAVNTPKQSNVGLSTMSLKQATDSVNRYCTCNENICNCCRDFHIPLVQLKGPGCASLQYLKGDNLAVQLSFGDNILTSTIVNGKSPKPVCVPLPGGFSKFCGRIYSIQRDAKDHFKACLGLELQSPTELEASLRVSCFRFGPDGLKLRPAEPLPVVEAETTSEEDDDDDLFGLGSDDDEDDDEEDDDEDKPTANAVPNSSDDEEEDDDEDVLGFGALLDIFTSDDESTTKKPKGTTAPPLLEFTIPILTRPTSTSPLLEAEVPTGNEETAPENEEETTEPTKFDEESNTDATEDQTEDQTDVTGEAATDSEDVTPQASNKIVIVAKPGKPAVTNKLTKVNAANKKKPSITSGSLNAIEDGNKKKKPAVSTAKPIKDEDDDDDDLLGEDDLDDDDEDDDILDDDDDDDEKDDDEDGDEKIDSDKHEDEYEDEKSEEIDDLDDEDDEEEDAVISALVGNEKGKKKKAEPDAVASNEEDDSDYSLGLTEFLARKRHATGNRQSRIMRL